MARRVKRKWNIIIPLGISIVLCVYLIVSMIVAIVKPEKEYLINTVGELDAKTTYELFEKEERDNALEIKDYFFYGESMNIYFDEYNQNNTVNSLAKKTLKFVDWLNEENTFTVSDFTSNVDGGLDLSDLKEGFYSVYVEDGEMLERLFYAEKLNFSFYTVTRDNQRKQVNFICDADYFHLADDEAQDTVLDKNYLYISVTSVDVNDGIYDVVITIDPSLTTNQVSDVGYKENGLVEQDELLEMAEIIKTDLEEEGLKVLVLSCSVDNNDHSKDVLFYATGNEASGVKSVLQQVYESKAKYMLHLDLDDTWNAGFVHYSNYASDALATKVYEALQQANLSGKLCPCNKGNDNDFVYEIRESGGKALSAATYSDAAKKNTFALNNRYGLNTIEVSYGNIRKADSVKLYLENKEALAHQTAKGILSYLTKTSAN